MEKAAQVSNIPSIAIENVKDTVAILGRVRAIRCSLVEPNVEESDVENANPRCLKDLLHQESYILHQIMEVISEIEKELL